MPHVGEHIQEAMDQVRFLSQDIGGRGSCTAEERRAAEHARARMSELGVPDVRVEAYQGAASTYRPYALAFAAALLGTGLVWLFGGRGILAVAAVLQALGAWGMIAETDFATNWMRILLPRAGSQNAVGVMPPAGPVYGRVVLCAHLDTHRTPIFYSSRILYTLFGLLVAGACGSMIVGAGLYGLAAAFDWTWARWIGLVTAAVQLLALGMCLHADLTPFSPGANDDASGVGVILSLAARLVQNPLSHAEVWLAFTGCEEVAAYGMAAFLDAHAAQLGADATYVVLDEVGLGQLGYLTADGLILKRKTHRRALDLARQAAAALLELPVDERVGIAYTDAAVATKRGLIALTLVALPPSGTDEVVHWHQMSDTLDHVDPKALARAYAFTWQLLQEIDRSLRRGE
jgi:acetylornithine deacetylase/succinyl-diaminopimelate desuccinylase-like protein